MPSPKVKLTELADKNSEKKQEGGNAKDSNDSWRASRSSESTYVDNVKRKYAAMQEKRRNAQNQKSEDKAAEENQNETKNEDNSTNQLAELTKQLRAAERQLNAAKKQIKQQQEQINKQQQSLVDFNKSFMQRNKDLQAAEDLNKKLQAEGAQKSEAIQIMNDNYKTSQEQSQAYKNRIDELENTNKEADEKNERILKTNQDLLNQRSILTETIRQSALKSPEEVAQAQKELESAAEPKVDNSVKTGETAIPEGEAKVEGEPKTNTEQAQATQEPKGEAKQPSTESSEMTPEEVYDYLSNKENFKEADTYFSSGKDGYITKGNKYIPKSWFEVYKGNKDSDHSMFNRNSPNNKDVFTASLRDKGLLEDPKKEPNREDTEKTLAETEAKRKFDEWIDSKGNKLRGIIRKHPWISGPLLLSVGAPVIMKAINAFTDYGREQAIEDMQVPDEEFWGNSEDNDDFNGEPTEPGEVAEKVANAAQETEQADNNAEEQAAQALQENLPQDTANAVNQGESPVATSTTEPTKPAPTQSAQGLPPVVTRNTPSTNPDSSGMTYSQKVEAADQAPQAGSMAYNANNPDMVTANLINAMNQAPQAGSDAIGYGDLYDQNFIDFWAKRNPNLAFGVSQGRR